ncbi:helicase [Patescibacteria group bacterium]|nr:helicase [Patescibacteria group bacterium]
MSYKTFLENKRRCNVPTGFEPPELHGKLFDFQKDIVSWACRRGRAALFEDCGLGKTPQQLAWANQVLEHTGKNQIIIAPLGVSRQHVREGKKFGIDVNLVASMDEVKRGISITNYEKLHKFDLSKFEGVVLDESSILKSYSGATRNEIIDKSSRVRYKLACTATPAPNDYMELGNHSEFLGVMSRVEMLATFFIHDGGETSKWRLKGHAESDFWKWLCSWSVNIRKPSDLGYEDGKFKLPKLNLHEHIVSSKQHLEGHLFALPASTLQERRNARRASLNERVRMAADLCNNEQWVFWCNLNQESEALTKALDAEEIRGSTSEEERERIILGFLDGSIRRVVSKPSIWGFGLNLQCCHNTALVGISDSYEEFYQVLRRFWRFGQEREVDAHVIISELEGAVLSNIKRKEEDARRMGDEMIAHMANISSEQIKGASREIETYNPQQEMILPNWI